MVVAGCKDKEVVEQSITFMLKEIGDFIEEDFKEQNIIHNS
jgi:hypothetical protein